MAGDKALQADYWRSASGDKWAEMADRIDPTHAPVTAELVRRAGIAPGMRVLDVGCGAGTSTRAVMAALGGTGAVTGLDLSPRLLAAAAAAAPRAVFIEGDAQDYPFSEGAYDVILSQFGVMFFADSVAAFANLCRAAAPGGRLVFAAWAGPEVNPWFKIPTAAALAELGDVESDPDGPGPMRFRDRGRVTAILDAAGWREVRAEGVALELTPPGGLEGASDFVMHLGGAARVMRLREADAAARARVQARIRKGLAQFETDGEMRVPAVINFYEGRA